MTDSPFQIESDQDSLPNVQSPAADPRIDQRARQRVKIPGRVLIAAGMLGMIIPLLTLLASGIALSMAISWEQRLLPLAGLVASVIGLVWYGLVVYGGTLLSERRKPGLVKFAVVMLFIGAIAGLPLALSYYPLHLLNIVLAIVVVVLVFRALQDSDVKAAIRQRQRK